MNSFDHFALYLLAACAVVGVCALTRISKTLRKYMPNINEQLAGINTRLDEATAELLALIGQLQQEQLTPEGRQALADITTKVNALADVVPNPTP